MDWLPAGWTYWLALGGSPTPSGWGHDETQPASPTTFGPLPDLTAVNLWLIQLTYQFVAAESHCSRCGDTLGRGLRVIPSAAEQSPWTVSIITRCHGWRRHRHLATVVEVSNDLMLGPFRAN
jgi:hypothetical protein